MATHIEKDLDAAADAQLHREELLSRPFGGRGVSIIGDTLPRTGMSIFWIVFRAATVIESCTAAPGFNAVNLTGKTFNQGDELGARLSAIKLTSGEILCYEL